MPTPLENLAAVVNTDAYDQIAQAMVDNRAAVLDNNLLFAHVKGLAEIMPRLKDIVGQMSPALEPEQGETEE